MRIRFANIVVAVLAYGVIFALPLSAQMGSAMVTITSPTSGATVTGTTTVRASVNTIGMITVVGVQFKLDGTDLGAEDTTNPYSVPWDSTMTTNGSHTLTAVARDLLGIRYTSSPVTVTVSNDKTPPAVTITFPTTGSTVAGAITVTANASDNVGVVGVQFRLDGAALGSEDTSAPYSVSWDTRSASNNTHTLTAVARDAAGNSGSSSVNVTVLNDSIPPTVSITSPAPATTVGGTVTVSANASDNVGVAGVQFRLDGANLGAEDTSAPYSVSWDTRSASNSTHTLTAVARDAAGNSGSSSVNVTVLNDSISPTVSITSPAPATTVGGTVTVSASASDNGGVAGVQFRLDGNNLGAEDTAEPYSVSWNTTAVTNGSHTLTAVARDAAGNQTTSAAVSLVVCNASGATYFEDTDACASFTSGWTRDSALRAWSGGTAALTTTAGAQATFTFTGTSVSWIGFRGPQTGIARVSVDGTWVAEIDTFSQSEAVQSVVFRTSGLAVGAHTLVIEATGRRNALSTSNYVVVDAFDLSPSPIITENQLPGSPNWQMWLNGYRPATDVGKQIKGYASATSVNKGGSISFHVTVAPAQTFTIDVYRMGWYQGLGGRMMQHIGPINGVQQPDCPVDGTTGLIECPWPANYTLNVPGTWTSGVFLAQLTNEQGYQNYIVFVVRDDARRADILYQQAVNTYQAYNNYPNDGINGKGLYDYNSYGPNTVTGAPRAAKVSFNRPYTGNGSGHFLSYEYYFVRWMERSGYDVTYSTDIDNHQNGARLLNSKAFLSVGHDEYWSKQMYDAAEQARDAGTHLGFFEANAVYWQVRFEASPTTGVPDRVMVGYKDSATDPVQGPTTTVQWRSPMINRPEQLLMGVQYLADHSGDLPNSAYIVANSSNWVYAGTGLADGSSIPGIVGYEVDSSSPTAPLPASTAGTYTVLSQSPFYDDGTGQIVVANSSVYQAPSGAWIFGAGTICWSWGLDYPGVADVRIQQITANVLNRFLGVSMQ